MFTWSLLSGEGHGYEVTSKTEEIYVSFLKRLEMAGIGYFDRVIVERAGETRKMLTFILNERRFKQTLKFLK